MLEQCIKKHILPNHSLTAIQFVFLKTKGPSEVLIVYRWSPNPQITTRAFCNVVLSKSVSSLRILRFIPTELFALLQTLPSLSCVCFLTHTLSCSPQQTIPHPSKLTSSITSLHVPWSPMQDKSLLTWLSLGPSVDQHLLCLLVIVFFRTCLHDRTELTLSSSMATTTALFLYP